MKNIIFATTYHNTIWQQDGAEMKVCKFLKLRISGTLQFMKFPAVVFKFVNIKFLN